MLKRKTGPTLLQFGQFSRSVFHNEQHFLQRLVPFLRKLHGDHRFVVEIRNRQWLDARFLDTLREHGVALADSSWTPRPWEIATGKDAPEKSLGHKQPFDLSDLIAADFAYAQWLGDRRGI